MNRIKNVGIIAWKVDNVIGITLPYMKFAEKWGRVKFITPDDIHDFDVNNYDIIIMPGGPDVNPKRYKQKPHSMTGNPCINKEFFDENFLEKCVNAGLPIFGICRGFQSLNVFFGGKLKQHISTKKHGLNGINRATEIHELVWKFKGMPNTLPQTIEAWNEDKELGGFKVNSIHHQAVLEKNMSKEFYGLAFHHKFQDHVEAFIHKTLPIAGVQWHPEELEDEFSVRLLDGIIQKAEEMKIMKNNQVTSIAT